MPPRRSHTGVSCLAGWRNVGLGVLLIALWAGHGSGLLAQAPKKAAAKGLASPAVAAPATNEPAPPPVAAPTGVGAGSTTPITISDDLQHKATMNPAVQKAVDRAHAFLFSNLPKLTGGHRSLVHMALIKSGIPGDDRRLEPGLHELASRVKGGRFVPVDHHVYEAGVTLLALSAANPKQYKPQIEAIAKFLIEKQGSDGYWGYPNSTQGDTSISQYAILALWEAARQGIDVPPVIWDKAAYWFVSRQMKDGTFTYHPTAENVETGGGSFSMTAAGLGSLLVIRLNLYPFGKDLEAPDEPDTAAKEKESQRDRQKREGPKFGVLELVDERMEPITSAKQRNYVPKTRLEVIDRGIRAAIDDLDGRFIPYPNVSWPIYYMYGIERAAAILGKEKFGDHDWFAEVSQALITRQQPDGSFGSTDGSYDASASFAVLALTRPTRKMVNRPALRKPGVGTGLLIGGRGLPTNLNELDTRNGEVKVRKLTGPADKMLSELENTESVNVAAAQQALLEQVQLSKPTELVGQTDRLLKLVRDPRVEVRRTAVWALGRTDNLKVASTLIRAMADADLSVAVEAHLALQFLSRRIEPPDLPLEPTAEQLAAQAQRWWKWYATVRPYDDRESLSELRGR